MKLLGITTVINNDNFSGIYSNILKAFSGSEETSKDYTKYLSGRVLYGKVDHIEICEIYLIEKDCESAINNYFASAENVSLNDAPVIDGMLYQEDRKTPFCPLDDIIKCNGGVMQIKRR